MSASSRLRAMTGDESAEAQAHAYAAYHLTGRSAVEVIDRMSGVMAEAMACAQRGEIERARRLIMAARAGLSMVSESLTATGTRVVVATRSPLLGGTPGEAA